MAEKYNLDELIGLFFAESRELLQDMEKALLGLESGGSSDEAIQTVFRAAHTIKGSAGMFDFVHIMNFTHIAESLLDDLRSKRIAIDSDIINLLLECHDFISRLLVLYENNRNAELDPESEKIYNILNKKLTSYTSSSRDIQGKGKGKQILKQNMSSEHEIYVMNKAWHISLRFKSDLFRHRLDPYSFIKYLQTMGEIVHIEALSDNIPPLNDMDPTSCYLGFEIDFAGTVTKEQLEEVFQFLQDDCVIRILPPKSNINEYVSLIQELPESPMRIGEILVNIGSLTEHELETVLKIQQEYMNENHNEVKRTGEIVVEERMVQKPVIDAALEKQEKIEVSDKFKVKTFRVDATKLDLLIDQVGELVISMARFTEQIKNVDNRELYDSASIISQLISDIRESTMNIRMVQIGDSLKRFERIVRDISHSEGKDVELVINGSETEFDKTIIEKITDPIMHLIRNAVDHGIDTPENRKAKGKSPHGKIILNAYHKAEGIIIEVIDDGNGLSREKIARKAIEKGLLNPESVKRLSNDEIYQYIFEPGFSTSEKVTNISGRGVGMDVVKKNIDSLRGSVSIQSKENEGTIVRLHLPLTLSIIDGFLVEVGCSTFVFPLEMVVECVELSKVYTRREDGMHVINLRGDLIPFLYLRDFFRDDSNKLTTEYLIISEYGRNRFGFVVDKAIGKVQIVVKPIGKVFNKIRWISGGTILGDGSVAMILDIPRLVHYIRAFENAKVK